MINFKNKLPLNKILCGDCIDLLKEFPDNSIDLVITSPPYFNQREYGNLGIGNESTVDEYVDRLIQVFTECVRIVKETGSIVFNIGDKWIDGNLQLVPYRFALKALLIENIKLINEVTWVKINPTPKQDDTKLVSSKEPFFIFVKSNKYYFDRQSFFSHKDNIYLGKKKNGNSNVGKKYIDLINGSGLNEKEKKNALHQLTEIIKEVKDGKLEGFRMKIRDIHKLPYGGQEGGRKTQIINNGFTLIKIYGTINRRDIIESTVENTIGNKHPAVYPEYVIYELIRLLTPKNAIILDPFMGSGTTGVVAKYSNRNYIGIEIFKDYIEQANQRISNINNFNLELFV